MSAACGGFLRERLLKPYLWVLMVKNYFSPPHIISVTKGKGLHLKKYHKMLCFFNEFICCYVVEGLES